MTETKSNIISGFHHLKMAKEHFMDFGREVKSEIGVKMANSFVKKIDAIYLAFITIIWFTDKVRDACRKEWNSDVFAVPAIAEKVALLTPEQRDMVETIIDELLKGKEIKFEG